jgi:hypothetical protein
MIMLNRQGRMYEFIHPECLFRSLTYRAMAVTAAIITDIDISTTITGIFMPSKFVCAALCNGIKGMQDVCIRIVSLYILLPKPFDDMG